MEIRRKRKEIHVDRADTHLVPLWAAVSSAWGERAAVAPFWPSPVLVVVAAGAMAAVDVVLGADAVVVVADNAKDSWSDCLRMLASIASVSCTRWWLPPERPQGATETPRGSCSHRLLGTHLALRALPEYRLAAPSSSSTYGAPASSIHSTILRHYFCSKCW